MAIKIGNKLNDLILSLTSENFNFNFKALFSCQTVKHFSCFCLDVESPGYTQITRRQTSE